MGNVSETMLNLLNQCEISLNGDVFSKEKLMQTYADFLAQTLEKRTHNLGVVLHSGSICFDALIITYSAITNLLFNQMSISDLVEMLEVGDIVLYGNTKKQRYVFEGFVDGEIFGKEYKGIKYIKLSQDNGGTKFVEEKSWKYIEPYNGNASKLDGRGIRKTGSERQDFFVEALGVHVSDIPSVIDTSTVIVVSREKADRLINGITIKFNEKTVRLLDIITASYYTENAEHPYGGNTGKNEPVLKLCAKVSVARKLILSRGGNIHIGLIVMGFDMISRGELELPELVNRNSLQYVYLSSDVEPEYVRCLLDENEDLEVFACTKEFLSEKITCGMVKTNQLTSELNEQIEVIKNRQVKHILLNNKSIGFETYRLFKNTILKIKRNQYESESKDEFIKHASSLFNLLMTAPFSVKELERSINEGTMLVEPISVKIKKVEQLADEIGVSLNDEVNTVISILKEAINEMMDKTPKEEWLKQYLFFNLKKQIVVVIPKAYYATVIKNTYGFFPEYSKNISIVTPGKFENNRVYDAVIVLGDFEGKRFNPFRCNASKNIITLLYEAEENIFLYKKEKTLKKINSINRKSTIKLQQCEEKIIIDNEQIEELLEEEKEIDNYLLQIENIIDAVRINSFSQTVRTNLKTEIVLMAIFSDESRAFFSKHYKAYVLDSYNGLIKSVGVSNLNEGDSIIFTKNNNQTKDIVDSILSNMVNEGKTSDRVTDAYNKSKEWKKSLLEYMKNNSLSVKEIVDQMVSLNVPVQEQAIAGWLDECSHTIGPQKLESFRAIGILTNNRELESHSELYFEACKEIRSIRRKILSEIGKAILNKLSGKNIPETNEFAEVYRNVDALAEILQIERLIPTEAELPINLVNRPISM